MDSGRYFSADRNDGASTELHTWSQDPSANSEFFEGRKNAASLVFVPSAQTDIYAQESLSDRCLWQVQYYSETLEPSSDVSLLAQTEQEQDDIFYATFPQARGLHWSPQAFQSNGYGDYFGGTGFTLSPNYYRSTKNAECNAPSLSPLSCGDSDMNIVTIASPKQPCTVTNESMAAIDTCDGHESNAKTKHSRSHPTSLSAECDDPCENSSSTKLEPSDVPLPQSPLQLDAEFVSQTKAFSNAHEPLMNFLSPSSTETDGCSPGRASSDEDTLKMDTRTWPSVRVRSIRHSSESDQTEPLMDNMDRPGASESESLMSTIIPLATPSSLATEPNPHPEIQPEPTGLMRLSPLPMNRRPVEKKKTQTLACNFCRVRKIACGPPLAGTVEKTCNQCQRRSRECIFPTESRRGVRKKKASASP
ncbi:hypothetical protein DFJ43DRAFT_1175884 [Lentinula guzmanii]|uniref:Zn(2)-C6 fungal-type domain-containing protein n=1 Tax=Lentinula guzmanii TaxID=2804957 RepID=A0AA38N1Y7_9AGAR|nr:hypothetical protein DFJ43DRAFT_1175884 [Lentinula guzmanii]